MKVLKRIQYGCISLCRNAVCDFCRKVLDSCMYRVQGCNHIFPAVIGMSKDYPNSTPALERKLKKKWQERSKKRQPIWCQILMTLELAVGNVEDEEDKVMEYSSKRQHMGSSYRGSIAWIRQNEIHPMRILFRTLSIAIPNDV